MDIRVGPPTPVTRQKACRRASPVAPPNVHGLQRNEERLEALSQKVSEVKSRSSSGSAEPRKWLDAAARAMHDIQLHSRGWIEQHIAPLPALHFRKPAQPYDPDKARRDIWLDTQLWLAPGAGEKTEAAEGSGDLLESLMEVDVETPDNCFDALQLFRRRGPTAVGIWDCAARSPAPRNRLRTSCRTLTTGC
ncbi:uncharacterized protein LOC143279973 [Babylonia areolata]|uniref:uncharacterized protein LOC143279973 n=1 Tax=Babylonia areolata TaxID=304850 RepID=UPI003FD43C59